ncbi:MAG: MBL fold metallo-hydrolase [Dictyoglomus sp. NZ13-RE01]|nr:MAG: MBL fold metallo-hydrolase [Dictyoglomus sp. NZ13-RE01]
MKIRWYGHACFLFTSQNGIKILTDPFDASVGYPLPDVEPNIVTISHDHFDHSAVNLIKGNFTTLKGKVDTEIQGIKIRSVKTFHDEQMGGKRGENYIFIFEIDGIRIAHAGDLGHILNSEDVKNIGNIDVFCVPVGGVYTVDANGALQNVKELSPKIVIPMHYKTPHLKFDLSSVENFLSIVNYPIRKFTEKEVELTKENLPSSTEVWVLNY